MHFFLVNLPCSNEAKESAADCENGAGTCYIKELGCQCQGHYQGPRCQQWVSQKGKVNILANEREMFTSHAVLPNFCHNHTSTAAS